MGKIKINDLNEDIFNKSNKVIFMPVNRDIESDVAGGDCSCIITLKGKVILIDTGAAHSYSLIKDELLNNNVNKIDYVIITHYHADHCENLSSLQADFDMENTIYYLCSHTDLFSFNEKAVLACIGTNTKYYPVNGSILIVDDLK